MKLPLILWLEMLRANLQAFEVNFCASTDPPRPMQLNPLLLMYFEQLVPYKIEKGGLMNAMRN